MIPLLKRRFGRTNKKEKLDDIKLIVFPRNHTKIVRRVEKQSYRQNIDRFADIFKITLDISSVA